MGFTNIYAKYLVVILLLWVSVANAQVTTTTIPGKLKIKTVPHTVSAGDTLMVIDVTGNVKKAANAVVLSVSGTTNQISSTGGVNPVIGISATYPGQSSITTLGTIISGVWHGTAIGDTWISSAATWNAKQSALTFNSGLTNTGGTVTFGGTILANTTINTGTFNYIINGGVGAVFNRTGAGGNIAVFQSSGTIQSEIVIDGVLDGPGIANYPNGRKTAFVNTSSTGTSISRDTADNNQTLTVTAINSGATGDIIRAQNYIRTLFSMMNNGTVGLVPLTAAAGGRGSALVMSGMVKPTANNDVLIGMEVRPVFGSSTIATLTTLVGGTGYPNGVSYAILTGGTGQYASARITVASGIITNIVLLEGGVNYTVGDVLTIVNAGISGTGGTVTVGTITSYTGLTNYAIQTFGLDQYDQDYSSTFTGNSKVNKTYTDTHNAGVSLTSITTAPIPFPKITTTQKNAISPVTEGMVVYDTTLHKISYYDGTIWQSP